MATMTVIGNDAGDIRCEECDTIFSVVFHRNPMFDGIEFCPFCGSEVDGYVTQEDRHE